MKFAIVNIITEDVHCTLNHVRPQENKRIAIKPRFGRKITQATDNERIWFVDLEVLVVGEENEPTPFNLKVRTRGVFEVEGLDSEQDKKVFNLSATETVFPYLRSVVATLTGSAFNQPFMLPAIPTAAIFPEDREMEKFEVPNQPTPEQS